MARTETASILDDDEFLKLPSGKLIALESLDFQDWLEQNQSFRFVCGFGGGLSYSARKEKGKRGGNYWHGYKRISGKLRKRYIGKTEEITLPKLKEIAQLLNEEVTQQVTPQKATQQQSQSYLTDYVTQGENLEQELSELREWKARAEKELARTGELNEALVQLRQANLQLDADLDRAVARMVKAESQAKELKAERDELDREVDRLTEKVGDKDLENQHLTEKLEQARAELDELRSRETNSIMDELPEAAELLNQLKGKFPKSKVSLREVESLLELIDGGGYEIP